MNNRVLTTLDERSCWSTGTVAPADSESLLRHSIFPNSADVDSFDVSGGATGPGVTRSHPKNTPNPQALSSPDTKAGALLDELNVAWDTRLTVVSGEEGDDVSAVQATITPGSREDPVASGANTGTPTDAMVISLASHQNTARSSDKLVTGARSKSRPVAHEPERNPTKAAIKTANEPTPLPTAAE